MNLNKKFIKITLISLSIIILSLVLFRVMFLLYENANERKQEYQEKIGFYKSKTQEEHKWISENQVANGAILFYKEKSGSTNVNPYFSNIAANSLLGETFEDTDRKVVFDYINWYFSHLNSEEQDKINGQGTIYDYKIVMENNSMISEESLNTYDSVDSYAASFLMLLNSYYQKTNDTQYVMENIDKVYIVIQTLLDTIDSDGLSKTKKIDGVKYLMDNVEVNKGMKDTIELLEVLSKQEEYKNSNYYNKGISLMKELNDYILKNTNAIEIYLWNEQDYRYEIGLDNNNNKFDFTGWDNFYADAVAQIFPIAFHVIDPESERAKYLYERFSEEYDWGNFQHLINKDSSFCWCILAYVGALMGDETRVDSFISYYSNNFAIDHQYPLYVADSGWYIMACDKMIQLNKNKIDENGIFYFKK